jgi:hypothetical protein
VISLSDLSLSLIIIDLRGWAQCQDQFLLI